MNQPTLSATDEQVTVNCCMHNRETNSRTSRRSAVRSVPPRRGLRVEWLAGLAALLCYVNVLPNEFSNDGAAVVQQNTKVNDPGQWRAIWTTDYWSQTALENPHRDLLYRPISLSSYRLVRILLGSSPLPHHIINILLHALLCALIARLCLHAGGPPRAVLIASLLFAVLPIHTEVLNNVVGRADLLAALGVLLCLLFHRRTLPGTDRNPERNGLPPPQPGRAILSPPRGVIGWRILAGAAAFMAMGSKESGVCVILLVPLFDALWFHRSPNRPHGQSWISVHTLRRSAYLLLPTILYFLLRYHALGGRLYQSPEVTKTINVLADAPPWQHGLGVIQLWGMYWLKTLWPGILCVNYSINGIHLATGPLDPYVLWGFAVGVGLVVASMTAWRRGHRLPAVFVAALLISYLPTSNALVLMQVFFAERIWYLPSVWVTLLIGVIVAGQGTKPFDNGTSPGLPMRAHAQAGLSIGFALCVLAIPAMAVRCWLRNAEWKNAGTLYAAAYRDLPDAVGVRYLYGHWLANHGSLERGIDLMEKALEIDLGFVDAHRALGQAYLQAGNLKAALKHLRTADMQVPGHPPTARALAQLSRRLAGHDEDLMRLRRNAAADPQDVNREILLIRKLCALGLTHQALARCRQREKDFSRDAAWQAEYAVTLVYVNHRDQAIDHYRQSLKLEPDRPQRIVELAMLLLERRQGDDLDRAGNFCDRANILAPDAPTVLACRAEVLAVRGDLSTAVALYQRAIDALPPGNRQRRLFQERATTLGK